MSSYTYFDDGNVKVDVEEQGGFIFIHMSVKEWNKDTYKLIKSGANSLFDKLKDEGHEWAFATSNQKQSTKFWNMVRPCYTINKFGPNDEYWIGAWNFEEE